MKLPCSILALAIALASACPLTASAQAICPWLNSATAAGLLGGPVDLSVTVDHDKTMPAPMYPGAELRDDRFDSTCIFQRKLQDTTYKLQITVTTLANPATDFPLYLARCPASIPLTAIGNQAVQCIQSPQPAPPGPFLEEVIGRVRNRAFTLTINRIPTSPPNPNALSDETRNLAEQIAGSLF